VTLGQTSLERRLLDGLQLAIPLLVGGGSPLFSASEKTALTHVATKPLATGVVVLF
jgi:hypothetical protein